MSSNSCKKPHQMISYKFQVLFSFKFVVKTIFFWQWVSIFFAAATECILILLTQFCLLVIHEPVNWCFLALFMANFKEVYVVSSSKVSLSKSVKTFHWIFGKTLSRSHALSQMHNFALICENTIFQLLLCQISALWMHYFYQFWSFCQFI